MPERLFYKDNALFYKNHKFVIINKISLYNIEFYIDFEFYKFNGLFYKEYY